MTHEKGIALPMVIIAIDLNLFKILSSDPGTLYSLPKLAEKTGAEELLLLRVLRGLVSHGLMGENKEEAYYANEATKLFANDGVAAGAKHNHLHVVPPLQCLPEFLSKTQYRNPNDSSNLPFQLAFNTDQTTFEWISHRPENLKWTTAHMAAHHISQQSWIQQPELFPVKDFTLHPGDLDKVLMVDVGGGGGQQCIALRRAHPELKGRVVLQDLPGTIAITDQDTLKNLNIESQGHDFMTPQPVTAAKVYYLRNILHDWPDTACMTILKHLRTAMSEDSVIMIDEIVVQKSESTWKQVNYDMVMMCTLGGIERTKDHWQKLLSGANLQLRDVILFDEETGDSVLVAEPAA